MSDRRPTRSAPALLPLDAPTRIAEDLRPLARPLDALALDPENVRLHPTRNLAAIKASLTRFGQAKPLVGRAGTSPVVVVAGNGTLAAARELGWSHLAVSVQSMTDDEARAYAVADNRTAELAAWDAEGLERTLAAVAASSAELAAVLDFPQVDLDALLVASAAGLAIEETAMPDLPNGDRSPFRQQAFSLHVTQDADVKRAVAAAIAAGHGVSDVNGNRNGNALAAIARAYLAAAGGA